MKKIILIILAAIAINGRLGAQEPDDVRDEVVFGFKIGANYSNVYDSRGEAFVADPKFGLATGAFLSIPFIEVLGIQPEVLFSQKGFHGSGRLLGSDYNFTRTTSFIDVPLFFALKPISTLTILIGPQYSYLIKQQDAFSDGPNTYLQEQEFQNENIHKNILCFAGGADINMDHTVFSLRACWDLQNNNGDGTSSIPRYKNVWYQATIGYRIY